MRLTSSLSLKNDDVEKHLLLSTSVPIKIGNDVKDSRKCNNRIRYTFGLRSMIATAIDANGSNKKSDAQKTQPEIPAQEQGQKQEQEQSKSNLADNISKNKLVKQTTIDYYV